MSVTFNSLEEAKEWKKKMEDKGLVIGIEQHGKSYKASIVGVGPTEITMHLNKGSYWDSANSKINVDKKELEFQPHVALAHEIGHKKLNVSVKRYDDNTLNEDEAVLQNEEDAWRIAAKNLKIMDEWNERAKNEAIQALASYYTAFNHKWKLDRDLDDEAYNKQHEKLEVDANKQAAKFIESL